MAIAGGRGLLTRWLQLPETAHLSVDDPETTIRRRRIVRDKPFVRRIYEEWYEAIFAALPSIGGPILELGSGAGFMESRSGRLIRSDILAVPEIDVIADASRLPLASGTLRAIVMTNVFHHLPDIAAFLTDAARCVRPGGALVMLEPWVSPWSRLIYTRLHSEPFQPDAAEWCFAAGGPLSAANGALPWIVFARDRARLERDFPWWRVTSVLPMMPLRYLVSGGVSMRCLVPNWSYRAFRVADELILRTSAAGTAMFARIVVTRNDEASPRVEIAGSR